MKNTTANILNALNNPMLMENYRQLKNNNPNLTFQETTLSEAYEDFSRISNLIINSSKNNLFDTIPFNKRNGIWSSISTIVTSLNQVKTYNFLPNNSNVVNLSNSIIQLTSNLIDLVETSNLYAKTIGLEQYKNEISEVSKIRIQYQNLINELNNASQLNINSNNLFQQINNNNNAISQIKISAENSLQNLNSTKEQVQKILNDISALNLSIQGTLKEIEAKKLSVETFSTNIDEYKQQIDEIKINAQNVVDKEKIVDNLINSAETALNLKSAEGISAAFSSQYGIASKNNQIKIYKENYINGWILGSLFFLLCALGITVWIASGHLNDNNNGISLLVARIIAVAISITGATFCSKQYIKQKNIAEDYAYKAVLSKSIIAFTDELKRKDEQRVAEYLTKVLTEIHQDPLRNRIDSKNSEGDPSNLFSIESIQKIATVLNKK